MELFVVALELEDCLFLFVQQSLVFICYFSDLDIVLLHFLLKLFSFALLPDFLVKGEVYGVTHENLAHLLFFLHVFHLFFLTENLLNLLPFGTNFLVMLLGFLYRLFDGVHELVGLFEVYQKNIVVDLGQKALVAVYDDLQYLCELFTDTKRFMFLKLFTGGRLSFDSRLLVSVLSQPVTLVSQMICYLCDLGDIDLLGVSPILHLLEEQLVFGIFLLDFGKKNTFLIVGQSHGSCKQTQH